MEIVPPPDVVAELASRYSLERLVGRGGMGAVHVAHDVRHGRKVALKLVRAEAATEAGRERFRHELEAIARLSHPHVVPLFDSGVAAGRPWYVMPFVRGGSLRARLERERRLPLEEVLRLAREIATGLGHAHRAGIVHRDVKPENVLLADGVALVADFGIALASGAADEPAEGGRLGTPAYMAPEQVRGEPGDARTDVYALACVVYELLAGRPPFVAATREALVQLQLEGEPEPLDARDPDVPPGVAATVARALEKSPDARPRTAEEFANALAEAARAGEAWTPSPTAPAGAIALPRPRTRFIGRGPEIAEARARLRAARLVTITGIGGCGKTRLALRVAEGCAGEFPDGVAFADLAPLQDAERVVLAAAAAFGVAPTPGVPVADALARRLAGRRVLLVVDNCEHVLDAAAALAATVLAASAHARVLCTSREGLGAPGESVLVLRSLPLPGADDPEGARDTDAVRLFFDRARSADRAFALDADTLAVVAEICRRLDGIPLAIELAAARVLVLSPAEIRARLDDRFRLLTGGTRTALPRHQTLAAAIGWSYDLLEPAERSLFRHLAVFVGGCELAAAARVVDEPDDLVVLDRLARLAEKSLVEVTRADGGTSRYAMLETVRQFALAKLEEAGEARTARERHCRWCVALAEEADAHVRGPEAGQWLARLEVERENLLSAHAWCDAAPESAVAGLTLQGGLLYFWRNRNLHEFGLRLAEEALARPGAAAPTAPRAVLAARASLLAMGLGRYERARALADEAVTIGAHVGDPALRAMTYLHLGAVAGVVHDLDTALAATQEGIRCSQVAGERMYLSAMLGNLGELHRIRGELDAAEEAYGRAVEACRAIGRVDGVANHLANQCYVLVPRGRLEEARQRLLESLRLCAQHGLGQRALATFDLVLALAAARDEHAFAAELWGAVEAARAARGTRRDPWDEAFVQEWRARAEAALGPREYAESVAWGAEQPAEATLAAAIAWLEAGAA